MRAFLFLLALLFATPAIPQGLPFPGPGSVGGATQVFSVSFTANATGQENDSFRDIIPSISTGGTKARVTLVASTAATTSFSHMSICVQSAGSTCVATPVELLVGGASGWTGTAGTSVNTDLATITTVAGNTLLVILDVAASNGNIRIRDTDPGGGINAYRALSAATYNSTTCAGCSLNGGGVYNWAVSAVFVQ